MERCMMEVALRDHYSYVLVDIVTESCYHLVLLVVIVFGDDI